MYYRGDAIHQNDAQAEEWRGELICWRLICSMVCHLWRWLGLALAMVLAGVLGTKLGLKVLYKVSDQRFAQIFNIFLTLLALRLIWQALSSLVK